MNIAFQIEVLANSDGDLELTTVECDPKSEASDGALEASEIDTGAWEFRFTVPDDFDGSEPVFTRFKRYRLDPEAVYEACSEAARDVLRKP